STSRQRKRFDGSSHRKREGILVDDQLDISLNVRFGDREMQAKWRSGMVATDDYAQPIANLPRISGAPLNRAILLSGELGGGPRCCFHASNRIKAKASDKQAEHRDSHSTLQSQSKSAWRSPSMGSDVRRWRTGWAQRADTAAVAASPGR